MGALIGHQVRNPHRVEDACAGADRCLAVLKRIPGDADLRREIVLVDRGGLSAARQQCFGEVRFGQVVVERVRVHFIADTQVDGEIRQHAPVVGSVERKARIAVRIVRGARNANPVTVADRETGDTGIEDIGRVSRGRRQHGDLRRAGYEVGHLDPSVRYVSAVAPGVLAARVRLVVAGLEKALKRRLGRNVIRPVYEQAVVRDDSESSRSRHEDRGGIRLRLEHAVLEIRVAEAKGVRQRGSERRIQPPGELVRDVVVEVPARRQLVAAESAEAVIVVAAPAEE